jgi:hypothetical protein
MFTLQVPPLNGAFSVRPVCKATDRPVVRELFRKAFYGDTPQPFLDVGLWEIYDNMEATAKDVYGAYLVYYHDRILFLLEIHAPIQMDLTTTFLSGPGTIGIYCFYTSPIDSLNLPALRTCIGSLLYQPGIDRILTTLGHPAEYHGSTLLQRAGFQLLPKSPKNTSDYCCTSGSLQRSQKVQNSSSEMAY